MTHPLLEPKSFHPTERSAAEVETDDWCETLESWDTVRSSALIHRVRWHSGLTQTEFAATYHIELAQLRDLERGVVQPGSALVAYLTVIDRAPHVVRMILATS